LAAQALGQSAMFAVLPTIGREVGLQEIQIGAIIAASSIVFFVASPLWGRASDRFGRRRIFIIGQIGYALGGSLFAASFWFALEGWLTPLVAWFSMIAARMTQASLMSASAPAAGAYIADITSANDRARGLARIGAANNLGSIAGPAVGGMLAAASLFAPFVLAVVSVGIAAVLSYRYLPATGARSITAATTARPKLALMDRRVLPWIVPGIAMFMGAAVVQQTLSLRIQDALALPPSQAAAAFGTTMMASAIAGLLAQSVIVQRVPLLPITWLLIGLPLIVVALGTMALLDSYAAFVVANVLMGFGMGFAGAGFSAGASLAVTAEEQGGVAGVSAAASSAGWIIGPLLGPGLYQVAAPLPFLVAAALIAAVAVHAFVSRR
ncbi:MAG: MFS transporter, partial [Proteobacteria bacterium]|nr:MFS transporter [Pseudomonadota bacterium]